MFPALDHSKKIDNLNMRWVYMDTHNASSFFEIPSGPPRKQSGWSQEEINVKDIAPLVDRMKALQSKGLTAPMVVKEFVSHSISPLQRRERSVWKYGGVDACKMHR